MLRRLSMAACSMLVSATVLAQVAEVHPLSPRDPVSARFERLSDAQLKALFLRCSREATQRLLGLAEGALCSSAGDVLKERIFGGDFNALLAWWRTRRDDPTDPAPAPEPRNVEVEAVR